MSLTDASSLKKLGEGAYGSVYDFNSDALKITEHDSINEFYSSLREMAAYKALGYHPSIALVKKMQFSPKDGKFAILMEKYKGHIGEFDIDKEKLRELMYKIAKGLEHMHDNFIIHRDLKLENILLDREWNVYICDLGISRWSLDDTTLDRQAFSGEVQTCYYRSPEIILGERAYTSKIDIWSLGIIFFELFLNDSLSEFIEDDDKILFEMPNEKDWPGCRRLPKFHEKFSHNELTLWELVDIHCKDEKLSDLIKNMTQLNPRDRFSIWDVLNHPYFNDGPKGSDTKIATRTSYCTSLKRLKNLKPDWERPDNFERTRTMAISLLEHFSKKFHTSYMTLFSCIESFEFLYGKCSKPGYETVAGALYICISQIHDAKFPTYTYVYNEISEFKRKVHGRRFKIQKKEFKKQILETILHLDFNLLFTTHYGLLKTLCIENNTPPQQFAEARWKLLQAFKNGEIDSGSDIENNVTGILAKINGMRCPS